MYAFDKIMMNMIHSKPQKKKQ